MEDCPFPESEKGKRYYQAWKANKIRYPMVDGYRGLDGEPLDNPIRRPNSKDDKTSKKRKGESDGVVECNVGLAGAPGYMSLYDSEACMCSAINSVTRACSECSLDDRYGPKRSRFADSVECAAIDSVTSKCAESKHGAWAQEVGLSVAILML